MDYPSKFFASPASRWLSTSPVKVREKGDFPHRSPTCGCAHMRRRLTTLRAVILNGYSIEFLAARNTDGDEVSVKFSLYPQYKFTFLWL